jgi:hypothetical protein
MVLTRPSCPFATERFMRSLILVALMACLPAHAGEVYKCKGPNGEITFTNIKCPAHTDSEHYATYQPEPEAPPAPAPSPDTQPPPVATSASPLPVEQPVQATTQQPAQTLQQPAQPVIQQAVQQPVQQPMQAVVPEAAQPAQPATDATATLASGYKCSEGENVWMQSTPCPATGVRSTPKTIDRPVGDALPVGQPAALNQKVPVNKSAPSQGALCEQLVSQASSPAHQKGGAGADELDKLLAANGCKR